MLLIKNLLIYTKNLEIISKASLIITNSLMGKKNYTCTLGFENVVSSVSDVIFKRNIGSKLFWNMMHGPTIKLYNTDADIYD